AGGVPLSLLEVRDLTVTYPGGVAAVRGVDLRLEAGRKLGIAGESGCGKSTLALALLRLLPAGTRTGGQVLLDGEDVLAMKGGRGLDRVPGRDALPEPGAPDRRPDRRADPAAPPGDTRRGPAQGRGAAGTRGPPGGPGGGLPARAVRRTASAGDDRHGPGLRS